MTNFYVLALTNTGRPEIIKRASGSPVTLAGVATSVVTGSWYTLRLEASGSTLTGILNGTPVVSATDGAFAAGRAGLATYCASASFDDVLVETVSGVPPTSPPRPRRPARRLPGPAFSVGSNLRFSRKRADDNTRGRASGALLSAFRMLIIWRSSEPSYDGRCYELCRGAFRGSVLH